jgi:hypothetical protein
MRLRLKELALFSLPVLIWAIITTPIIKGDVGPLSPEPMASLRVSLPAGTYIGLDPDPWITESWVLMLSGTTWIFDVNVTQKHNSYSSYDTHLIVALTSDGYSKLSSLTISGGADGVVEIYAADFTYGTPTYYMYSVPPHGVFPTWFNDSYLVGDLAPNTSVILSITASFSPDTIGVKMHFDAVGTRVPPPPETEGDVTHNPESVDSTVVPPPPPPVPETSLAMPLVTSIGTILLIVAQKALKQKRD